MTAERPGNPSQGPAAAGLPSSRGARSVGPSPPGGRGSHADGGRWSYLARRWERLGGPGRIAGIDLARGLAVLGMFAAHLLSTGSGWVWTEPDTWLAVVDGRSSILFATLAGVSIGLVTGGRAPLAADRMGIARGRLALRALALLVLGILLILTGVPVYVILPAYAILFLLALPFTALGARVLLPVAAVLGLAMPFLQPVLNVLPVWQTPLGDELSAAIGWNYPFPVWIAFVLAGLGLARAGVTRLGVQCGMLGIGAALAATGYGLDGAAPSTNGYLRAVWTAEPHSSGLPEVIGSGGFAVAVLGACLLLCRLRAVALLTLPLRATGAMPLTAYTVQLTVWAAIAGIALGDAGDLSGFRELEPFWPLIVGTLIGCTLWALLVGRGPLEWALDRFGRFVVRDEPEVTGAGSGRTDR